MDSIKAKPTDGLCYNPSEALYWDTRALEQELERVFDICHGCMCFNLCGSFPALFEAVDREDGNVRKLTGADNERVVDECFQCKLCYVKCPYTADDDHYFDLDFPRLMLRYTLQRAKAQGVDRREKLLGDPVRLGEAVTRVKGVALAANLTNRFKPARLAMEAAVGIHRNKKLPGFAGETFEAWFGRRAHSTREPHERVALFHSCYINFNAPEIGKAAIDVLERSNVQVMLPTQTCCGMPALDGGDFDFAREQACRNVESLLPLVEKGMKILVINPTCSYTLRKEYPEIVGKDTAEQAARVAGAVRDVCEYLFELKKAGQFDREFRSTPGEIGYHIPCHLKAQSIGFRSRDMMKIIPGVKVKIVDRCCGHDGTWAMKKENFESSMKIGKPAFDAMGETLASGGLMTTDCPLAAIQFEQATGTRPLHPLQVLERAYRRDGFRPIPPSPKD
jgi:Fe-S oxidoreductase